MLGIPLKYNFRHLVVRWVATVMTALGIALPTGVFCAVLALNKGLETALKQTGRPDTVVFLRKNALSETNSSVSREDATKIEALSDVAREGDRSVASREVIVLLNLPRIGGGGNSNVAIRGTTARGRALRPEVQLIEGQWPGDGLSEVVVARGIANRFENCQLGSRLPLGKRDWRVVGIFDAGATAYGSEIWGDAETLAGAFLRDAWSAVWVKAKPSEVKSAEQWIAAGKLKPSMTSGDEPAEELLQVKEDDDMKSLNLVEESLVSESALELLKAPKKITEIATLEAMTEVDYFRKQTELGSPIAGIGSFIALVMAVGAAFAVMNTMYAAIASRSREIAVLRAIGYPRRAVMASFLIESIILALVGGLLGALASLAVNGISTGTTNFATFSELTFAFRVTPEVLGKGCMFGGFLGVLGGLLPAYRASRTPILQAMRAI